MIVTDLPADISYEDFEKLLYKYKDEDYITIITCTPYGLNTHRLLVRGKRVVNDNNLPIIEETPKLEINTALIYYVFIFIGFIVYMLIRKRNNYIL